ncbi:MAG: hypothetical protein A3G33_11110 [Omnitrophica bacterium RIFCSPLOWO2_12_FULL_44_17]|uniref:Hemerythrin-like domain-containing protein n=1 Tax=Candidatus Danuiimicrobium aquiferis TaxID=1801832 RepID=A0A1G1KT21_9BACT|nr:MAG: hypothetical protein A3B72_01290 [Omnitrophica bacterium RIFCSPHIGHO2_02_FULL_45_28]OGW91703.1 MAG: hypothetical protein A3E74_09780 [Omnitrophica bacterium RIFCSPHIGHO2_12_FULL_44_12]OGW96046.1 MAG: hypothetical protein A3G33_11110 [Omnitrophica bacterium RIFCSPLOWO2_12_FULL_44_17]OGX02866.1 MAG: hypothetical protein A3J12_05365 [Omnitrophica bacterium RIFCSPLOWO2_02_FULL_44_11]
MEKYLNVSIKEIIGKFPEVGRILEEYKIGCVPCTLGSCLLKDVVGIHNLPADQEAQLLYRIEKAIYPKRNVKRPEGKALTCKAPVGNIKYSPPIKRLVDEHIVIKQWLELIPSVLEEIDIESEAGMRWISDSLDFVRFYADKFHHAKEEDILFGYTDKNLDIIKTILRDHETARGHVKATSEAVKSKDKEAIVQHLSAYKDLLKEHIKKEDEILYPWIDRGLSTRQVGELFAKFDEAEARIDKGMIEQCEKFAHEAEEKVRKIKKRRQQNEW